MTEIDCNQINNDLDNDKTRFSSIFFSVSERNPVLTSLNSMLSTFCECTFREQEHLKRENEDEMESTCCLQISSVFK